MHILTIAGSAIFLLLGVAHTVFTFQSKPTGGPMMPTNPDTQAAMQVPGGLGIDTSLSDTLYRAWIGFNLSHSLGLLIVALVLGVPAVTDFDAALAEPAYVALAVVAPALYLTLSVRYWFAKPTQGIAMGLVLVWAGVIGGLVT